MMKKGTLFKYTIPILLPALVMNSSISYSKSFENETSKICFIQSNNESILNVNQKAYLYFNGNNSYGTTPSFLENYKKFTLMGWISLSPQFQNNGFIMGENNFNISCDANKKIKINCFNNTLISAISLDAARWYHITATYDGKSIKLYLNGELINQQIVNSVIAQTLNSSFTIGKNPINNSDYFFGKMDEVRVFSKSLTASQIQHMVYQEISNHNGMVKGSVVSKNITDLNYGDLIRYYKMDLIQNNVVQNQIQTNLDTAEGIQLYNLAVIENQEAPMPFITKRNGNYATAINDDQKDIFGKDAETYPWSIIQIKHDISQFSNSINFGLIVDADKTITVLNNTKLENSGYLKINGKIDLEGQSQLIQTKESELDPTSTGHIERDQQGQSNKFNYNYWSSPVSSINSTTINHGFTVASIMKDGTDPTNPRNINWVTGINNPLTNNPITLSSYWIFKFQNLTPVYANWASVGQNGLLHAGQGYTMKGSGNTTNTVATQNYVFVGKPNNGTITSNVSATNLNLSGNPYPSTLDSSKFIKDNLGVMNGTLYFWEHFPTNNTHTLAGYQGGYAARTLVGGTAPISQTGTSGLGTSTRIPGRFIPVGQGFFVTGNDVGGDIIFDNSQRLFVKETNVESNILFRTNQPSTENTTNQEDYYTEDTYMKFRIGFNSYNNFHRQLLIGFMEDLATEEVDPGYDAIHIDNQQNDMYFLHNQTKLTIQGASHFEPTKTYALGIKTFAAGDVQFTLDGTENVADTQAIYIHDNVTNMFHDIRQGHLTVNLPQGEINNRFTLTFQNGTLSATEYELQNLIAITYTSSNNILTIRNTTQDNTVETVSLFTTLGQTLATWNVENQTQNNITLPISNVSTGTYIVRVQTTLGTISKKIIIK
jgi:hypothetical protein